MEYKMNVELTYKEVWQTLNALDLSEYHDKKGNFTYLSWTDAWQILMEQYSFATYEFMPETYEANGTVMSHCIVRIGNLERYMWLPCMDNRNNSLTNPTTRQIQDTRMRCMVKCLAMFGLANYIFRGEDLPDAAKDEAEAAVVKEEEPTPDQYRFVSDTGSVIGTYIDEAMLMKNALINFLGTTDTGGEPTKEQILLYEANKNEIKKASESANKKNQTAYTQLIEKYESTPEETDEQGKQSD